MPGGWRLWSGSPAATRAAAARVLERYPPPVVLALHGPLGSGKTCFVQGLAAALGVRQPVGSPTYTLINEYASHPPLYHVDLYRIDSADDVVGLGLDEYFDSDAVVAVEWAERAGPLLPEGSVHVVFDPGSTPAERLLRVGRGALS